MAAPRTPVASLGEVQPAEVHLDGTWRAAEVLGWRFDDDGRCRARVRFEWSGAPRTVWAPLELLRLPEPAPDVVVPVPRGSRPPVHRTAAPLPRPGDHAVPGRWTPGRPAAPGRRPETWREDHPHAELLDPREYELRELRLQVELLKLQREVVDRRQRVAVVLEGRDAAGTEDLVRSVTEHLDPRRTRVVGPGDPAEPLRLALAHLPAAGEIVLFDRSWYGRPAVECGTGPSLHEPAASERLLVAGGLRLVKLWFAVSRGEQRTRLALRRDGCTLTTADLAVLDRWDDHTAAEAAVFAATSTPAAPWTVVRANDERRARVEAMRHLLSALDPAGRRDAVGRPDPLVVGPAPLRAG
jgi:polyphosphate kinase